MNVVVGATGQVGSNILSEIKEKGLNDLKAEVLFIRPSYYFSNWLGFLETVQQYGSLPTFIPEDLKIEMHSPKELAGFIAQVITEKPPLDSGNIMEVAGPQKYSALDVAHSFSRLLKKEVNTQTIPKSKWNETLTSVGFTENTATNLGDMTQALIDN